MKGRLNRLFVEGLGIANPLEQLPLSGEDFVGFGGRTYVVREVASLSGGLICPRFIVVLPRSELVLW